MFCLPPSRGGGFCVGRLLDKVEKLLYCSTAGSSELDEGSYMEHDSSSLRWRRIEVVIGWGLFISYAYGFLACLRNARVDNGPTHIDIIMHSIAPLTSLMLWVAVMLFAMFSCISLIIGANDYASGFSWVPLCIMPVLAGLGALAPIEASWTDVDGVIASLYYLILFGLTLALRLVSHYAHQRDIFYP